MAKAVYIHIPFCRNICTYCDFCKMNYHEEWICKYLKALKNEIKQNYKNEIIKTLYVGGGTPSCLTGKNLSILCDTFNTFKLSKNYEFTFECNVEDINENLLIFLKNNKVNRLSIGIQTFNKKYLKFLGRKITNINDKITLAKKYFSNINVDLMYGFYNQTIEELEKDLDSFIKLNVSHISAYCLILENNTILKANGYIELKDVKQKRMYQKIRLFLKRNNYIHYELSNFAKKGYESKHNLTYWNNDEYYGFGLGASGFLDNKRYTNTKSINNYLEEKYIFDIYEVTKQENMENEMILGLRKIKGVSKKKFYNKYNENIKDVFDIKNLKETKYYYSIPTKYLFVINSILVDFININ